MNTYRYDEEKRRQWVREKITRAKSVKQICKEALISRATLYNWLDEFKYLEDELKRKDEDDPTFGKKSSKPELLQKTSPEAGERYRMLVAAIAGIDTDKTLSKKLVAMLVKRFTLTVPQACAVVGIPEDTYGYKPRKPEVEDYIVYEALVNLIHEDRKRDFETCYELLLQRNPDWTRKQIKRVYRDGMVYLERERSNIRWEKLGKAKKKAEVPADGMETPVAARVRIEGGTWNLILLEYTSMLDGLQQDWWMLCITDEENGMILNARAGIGNVGTEDLLAFLDHAAAQNGVPRKMKVAGKPALTVREVTRWVWQHKMALHTFSLNKQENLDVIAQMENDILRRLSTQPVNSVTGLLQAAEHLIAVPQSV